MFRACFAILLMSVAWSVDAEPVVLADFGGKPTEFAKMKIAAENFRAPAAPKLIAKPSQFPLFSKRLSVGVVENHKHQFKVVKPVFITGVDHLSLEWLRANQEHLREIGSKGIVTNIASSGDFEKLKALFPELNFSAVPVEQIAEDYGLTHYPVLIDKEDIRQ